MLHILPYNFEIKYTPQDKLSHLIKTIVTTIHQKNKKTGSYLMLLVNNSRFLTIVNMKSPKDISMVNSVTYEYRNIELTDIQYKNASKGILFDPISAPLLRKVLELHKEILYNHQLFLNTKLDKYLKTRDIYRRKMKTYLLQLSKVKNTLLTDISQYDVDKINRDDLTKKELKINLKKEKKQDKVLKKKVKSENKLENKLEKVLKKKEKKIFKKETHIQMKKTPHNKNKVKKVTSDSFQLKIHSKDPFGAVSLINNKNYIDI